MKRAPLDTLPGQLKTLGLVMFSVAINAVIGLSGYFGVNSPRLNVRRLLCLWLTVFFYYNLIFRFYVHMGWAVWTEEQWFYCHFPILSSCF
jgi:hypothetical protein